MLNNLRNTSLWEFEVHVLLLILQTRFSPRSFYRVSDYDEISEGSILCTILYPQERGRANSLVSNYSVMSFKYFLFHFFSQRPLRCGLIFRRDNSTSSIHLISIHRAPLSVCIHLILNGFRGPSPPCPQWSRTLLSCTIRGLCLRNQATKIKTRKKYRFKIIQLLQKNYF